MATLYTSFNTGDDSGRGFYATIGWIAQTFLPDTAHIMSSVKVKLLRYDAGAQPGNITASIFATSGGEPTGSALASGSANGNSITTTSPGEWFEIAITGGVLLMAGTLYTIVLKCQQDDPTHPTQWRRDTDAGYSDGKSWTTTDQGSNWTGYTTEDLLFEDWGDPTGSGEGGSIFPSDATTRITSIIHRYNRGVYNTELLLGDVISDFGVPSVDREIAKSYEPKEEAEGAGVAYEDIIARAKAYLEEQGLLGKKPKAPGFEVRTPEELAEEMKKRGISSTPSIGSEEWLRLMLGLDKEKRS